MELQPLVWHQFKVLAANQYTTSLFSVPSKLEFAELRRPGPPREFRVLSMRTVKGHAEVDISWRKPESINGRTMIVTSPCILNNVWNFWKLTLGDFKVPMLASTLGFNHMLSNYF